MYVKVTFSKLTLCVLTLAPDSAKEKEPPVAAAVNSKPLKSYQISDPALLDGPPEQVCI